VLSLLMATAHATFTFLSTREPSTQTSKSSHHHQESLCTDQRNPSPILTPQLNAMSSSMKSSVSPSVAVLMPTSTWETVLGTTPDHVRASRLKISLQTSDQVSVPLCSILAPAQQSIQPVFNPSSILEDKLTSTPTEKLSSISQTSSRRGSA